MSRAARTPKTKVELQSMSLDELNAELRSLRARQRDVGTGVVAKLFGKEIARVEGVRLQRFGVKPRCKAQGLKGSRAQGLKGAENSSEPLSL